MLPMRLLITGGCGFIGSNFVRFVPKHYQPEFVTNVDVFSYAGNTANPCGGGMGSVCKNGFRLPETGANASLCAVRAGTN